MVRRLLLAAALALLPALAGAVSPAHFIPVAEKSSITFEAVQNNAPVTGEFSQFTADIAFTPHAMAQNKVVVTVDMASASTAYGEIASTLKTAEWFDTANSPQAAFETQSFAALGDNRFEAEATLTIKGHTRPVTLLFTLHDYSLEQAHITGEATLKRTDFGIGWDDTNAVKDDVKVTVEIHAVAAP